MRNNIDKLLKEKNRTRYWLAKEIGVSYPTMSALANNKTDKTKFETMERLCKTLNCTLNDLFELE